MFYNDENEESLEIKEEIIEIKDEIIELSDTEEDYSDVGDVECIEPIVEQINTRKKKQFGCDKCTFSTNTRNHLACHTIKEHEWEEHLKMFASKFHCFQCNYSSDVKQEVLIHKQIAHNTYDNDTLIRNLSEFHLLRSNRGSKLNGLKVRVLRKFFHCKKCDFKVRSRREFKAHEEEKHSLESYSCVYCKFKTLSKNGLVYHLLHTHGPSPNDRDKIVCEKCCYSFHTYRQLESHIMLWHEEQAPDFHCSNCDFKTKFKYELNIHIRETHIRKAEFECPECKFSTKRLDQLKDHIILKHRRAFENNGDSHMIKVYNENRELLEIRSASDFEKIKRPTNLRSYKAQTHIERRKKTFCHPVAAKSLNL